MQTEHVGDLGRCVFLLTIENIGARNITTSQFMNLDMGTKGNQANEGALGKEGKVLLQAVLQFVQVFGIGSGINLICGMWFKKFRYDKQKDRRDGSVLRDIVLDGWALLEQFIGTSLFSKILSVLRREVISTLGEWTCPCLCIDVDGARRVVRNNERGNTNKDSKHNYIRNSCNVWERSWERESLGWGASWVCT